MEKRPAGRIIRTTPEIWRDDELGKQPVSGWKRRGLPQEAVAERLGVSRQMISKWETGGTVPDIAQAKMAPLYGIAMDGLISFDAALSELRQAIEKTNGWAEKAVGWTSGWGKRCPVQLRCGTGANVQNYSAMLDELRQKYRFSSGIAPAAPSAAAVHTPASCTRAAACYEEQAGMLALKDILYQTWRSRKRENRITRGGFCRQPPFFTGQAGRSGGALVCGLAAKGKMGYIIPHKFMLIKSGTSLRKLLSEKKYVKQIIHFGTEQVFKGRSTYTCLLFIEKNERKTFEIGFVKDINRFYATESAEMKEYPIEYLSAAPWTFLSNEIVQTLEKKRDKCQPLDSLADIFVGLQTSADPIYIIEPKSEEKGIIKFIDCNGRKQEIEAAITKPCIYDMQLEKYAKIEENRRIIFPYYQEGKKQVLYSIDEMKQLFPKTLKYFESFKEELCKRSINNMSGNNWYQFGRSQSLKRFVKGEHLVWSVLATQGNYVYDTKTICFTGGGNGPFYGLEKKDDTKESLFYIQAVLNYWMIEMIVKSKASKFRGDYYSHGKQFVAQLPIYRINFDDSNEVKIHDEIVDTVKNLMKLKNKRDEQQTKPQKETYERLIQIEDNKLDGLISKLYGAENCRREDLDEE